MSFVLLSVIVLVLADMSSLPLFFLSLCIGLLRRELSLSLLLLLLLQLAHHPIKDSGRGLSLLRAPSIPPGKAATDIVHFRELVGKGNLTIRMHFMKYLQSQPLLAQLIQSGRSKGRTAF